MNASQFDHSKLSGVWSAAPTPLTEKMNVDTGDVIRMVEHHRELGVNGLFLAGTNGEGPWLPENEKSILVRTVADNAGDSLVIAVQVTDNSAARIRDNMRRAADDGAHIAVIAPPCFFMNRTKETLKRHYLEAADASPLPVGIYDRGTFGPVTVPVSLLRTVYAHENVIIVKDSSTRAKNARAALEARGKRPELRIFNGDEFDCVRCLAMGYDGLLLGGGIFNGRMAGMIIEAVRAGKMKKAEKLQKRMNRLMYAVYGGADIECWLSGEKKLLTDMGIFTTWHNFPRYPLTDSCIRAIDRALAKNDHYLLPGGVRRKIAERSETPGTAGLRPPEES